MAKGLAVLQPSSVKDAAFVAQLMALEPQIIVVVAFGSILGPDLLNFPLHGAINLHGSLLPRYRGAAPLAWAIAKGESRTGMTTQKMSRQVDAGDILLQRSTPIGDDETAGTLGGRLAVLGADLLVETLDGIAAHTIHPQPQDHSRATYAPRLSKKDGRIQWDLPAAQIGRCIRAFDPWPGAHTLRSGKAGRLLIWKASAALRPPPCVGEPSPAGTIIGVVSSGESNMNRATAPGVLVACADTSYLLLQEVQPEGSRRMEALSAVSGRHLIVGDRLGES